MSTPIENVAGIGPATATLLADKGIHSAEDLAAKRVGDLAAIKGFNTIRAGLIIAAAQQLTDAAVPDGPVLVVESDKKDKGKKDKKKKKKKEQMKKSSESEKKKSPKEEKKSSAKKGKDKTEKSKKKGAKKK